MQPGVFNEQPDQETYGKFYYNLVYFLVYIDNI